MGRTLLSAGARQTASRNLRLTRFEPFRYAVVLDRHDVDDTPLNSKPWTDEDFEEIDEEIDEEEQVLAES